MIALEEKYHSKCLATLYNRTRAANNASADSDDSDLHGKLVAFMEDFRLEEKVAPVFQLADLAQLYKTRLEQLGVAIEGD